MKKLLTNYNFNAASKTITFEENVVLEQLLLITNVTRNTIIYNFASSGGTLVGNVLTLSFNTTAMQNTDALQIFIDVPDVDFAALTELLQDGLVEIVRQLQAIKNDGGMADTAGRVRVAVETAATVPISITSNQDIRNITGSLATVSQAAGTALNQAVVNWNNYGAKEVRKQISIS